MKYHIYRWKRVFDGDLDYEDCWAYQGVKNVVFSMRSETSGAIDGVRFHSIYRINCKEDYMEINGFLVDNHTVCNIRCYQDKPHTDFILDFSAGGIDFSEK